MRYKKKYIPPKAIFEEIEGQDVMGDSWSVGGTDGGMDSGDTPPPGPPFNPDDPFDPFATPAKSIGSGDGLFDITE